MPRYGVVMHPDRERLGEILPPAQIFDNKAQAERFAVWLAAYRGRDAILLDGYDDLPAAGRASLRSVARVERDGHWRGWVLPPVYSASRDDA